MIEDQIILIPGGTKTSSTNKVVAEVSNEAVAMDLRFN
jgi:hypothetical protein